MLPKVHLTLQPSESVIVNCASRIYAAYVASGQVTDENEADLMEKSIQLAIKIGLRTDDLILSDKEFT